MVDRFNLPLVIFILLFSAPATKSSLKLKQCYLSSIIKFLSISKNGCLIDMVFERGNNMAAMVYWARIYGQEVYLEATTVDT